MNRILSFFILLSSFVGFAQVLTAQGDRAVGVCSEFSLPSEMNELNGVLSFINGDDDCRIAPDLKYVVLSASRSMRVSRGDNPVTDLSSDLENANCVFGYSNDVVYSKEYGSNFFRNLSSSDESLAEVFFRSSRMVSYSNIPVVMCRGKTPENSRHNIENARRFSSDEYGNEASTVIWRKSRKLEGVFSAPQGSVYSSLYAVKRAVNLRRMASRVLGVGVKKLHTPVGITAYVSPKGTLSRDNDSGLIVFSKETGKNSKQTKIADNFAIRIAFDYLKRHDLVRPSDDFMVTHIVDKVLMNQNENRSTTEKMVVFHQRKSRLLSLGQLGSIEVNLKANGEVTGFALALLNLSPAGKKVQVPSVDTLIRTAFEKVSKKYSSAKVTLLDTEIGYSFGSSFKRRAKGRPVVSARFLVKEGGRARQVVEKVPF